MGGLVAYAVWVGCVLVGCLGLRGLVARWGLVLNFSIVCFSVIGGLLDLEV